MSSSGASIEETSVEDGARATRVADIGAGVTAEDEAVLSLVILRDVAVVSALLAFHSRRAARRCGDGRRVS